MHARKYRLYPTDEQAQFLRQVFGACRFVYNIALETKITAYKSAGINLSQFDLSKQLTDLKKADECNWLRDVPAIPLVYTLRNLDAAYKGFFKSGRGFPKFKSRHDKQAFQIHQGYKIEDGQLVLPKCPEPIEMVVHRPIGGNPKTCTVSMTQSGRFYASFQVENDYIEPQPVKKAPADLIVGVDVNINSFDLSNGVTYETPQSLKENKKRLRFLQRQMRRKQKGSANRNKDRKKIAKLHERITAIRKDWIHNVTAELVSEYEVICIEDLNVAGMKRRPKAKKREDGNGYEQNGAKRKGGLNRSLADVAFGEFRRQLEYKCGWYGKTLLFAPRFEPTSKTCSNCLEKTELTLSQRAWVCDNCGAEHHRDINAAKNIKRAAIENSDYEPGQNRGLPVEGTGYRPNEAGSKFNLTHSTTTDSDGRRVGV